MVRPKRDHLPLICSECGNPTFRPRKALCIPCYNHQYYLKNSEKIKKNAANWRANNLEKARAISNRVAKKRWANLSPEEKLATSRKQEARRSPEERERRKAYQREYYQKNKGTDRAKRNRRKSKQNRRARESKVTSDLTLEQWENIKAAYNYQCAYCGKARRLTRDHIIPLVAGGHDTASNVIPSCYPCNRKKWKGPPLKSVQSVLL